MFCCSCGAGAGAGAGAVLCSCAVLSLLSLSMAWQKNFCDLVPFRIWDSISRTRSWGEFSCTSLKISGLTLGPHKGAKQHGKNPRYHSTVGIVGLGRGGRNAGQKSEFLETRSTHSVVGVATARGQAPLQLPYYRRRFARLVQHSVLHDTKIVPP